MSIIFEIFSTFERIFNKNTMSKQEQFKQLIDKDYTFKGESFVLGVPILEGEVIDSFIRVPLKTMNRHGLIAGATGTGKTKTLQVIAESLSDASVSVVMLDIKGDLSGLAASGTMNKIIEERYGKMKLEYTPSAFPVELMSISDEAGVRLRATVLEFGPVLFSKILALNDTQSGLVALIFKFCDDNSLPLVDLKDFIKVLQYISDEGKAEIEKEYGKIATTSTGTILRKVIELQQQGADAFFGEPSFDIDDLMRCDSQGRGMINIIRVTDMQDRPKMFSTFLLQILAEIYATCPEVGDMDKPKLVIFIDEAHLIFQEASSALLQQIEAIIKLIRSKGIGIFFCTQNPTDVPPSVLGQLGFKVQHALRAFTAKDRKDIKNMAENFPDTDYYEVDELLTQMGVGEAMVTLLNEKGMPTALAYTMLVSPRSRMDILSLVEIDDLVAKSKLVAQYNKTVDPESAYEILSARMAQTQQQAEEAAEGKKEKKGKQEKSTFETILNSPTTRQIARAATTSLVRGLLGVLGLSRR